MQKLLIKAGYIYMTQTPKTGQGQSLPDSASTLAGVKLMVHIEPGTPQYSFTNEIAVLSCADMRTQQHLSVSVHASAKEIDDLQAQVGKGGIFEITFTGEIDSRHGPKLASPFIKKEIVPILGETIQGLYLSHAPDAADPQLKAGDIGIFCMVDDATGLIRELKIPGRSIKHDLHHNRPLKEGHPVTVTSVIDGVIWGNVTREHVAPHFEVHGAVRNLNRPWDLPEYFIAGKVLDGPFAGQEIQIGTAVIELYEIGIGRRTTEQSIKDVTPRPFLLKAPEAAGEDNGTGLPVLTPQPDTVCSVVQLQGVMWFGDAFVHKDRKWLFSSDVQARAAHEAYLGKMSAARGKAAHQTLAAPSAAIPDDKLKS